MTKRVISLILALLIAFSSLGAVSSAGAAEDTMDTLYYLVNKFPHGKYWNHMGLSGNSPDSVTDTPCSSHSRCDWRENSCNCNSFDNAIQCMGYAYKIAYEITGVSARKYEKSYSLNASKLRVGDVIRYRNNGHSLCVTGVNGTRISFTDCNWIGKCQIRWSEMDISDIMGFSYVLHLKGNDRKNTELDFFEDAKGTQYEEKEAPHEVWEMNDEGNLNIRYDHSTDSKIIGKIRKGTEFEVYDKYIDEEYLWAKVKCGSTVGWCVLAYAEYVEGYIEKPNITDLKKTYTAGETFKLSWNEVSGTEKYTVYLYNSEKELIKKYTSDNESKKLTLEESGKYYIKIRATNSKASTWKIDGKRVSFEIEEEKKARTVTLSKESLSLVKGYSDTLEAVVTPENAENKNVVFESSDTEVATVSSSGKVEAVGFGTAVITCTAEGNPEAEARCTVTVVPGKVKGVKQTSSSTTAVRVKWSSVKGADSYRVYEYSSETKTYELIATTKKTEWRLVIGKEASAKVKIRAVKQLDSGEYIGKYSDAVTLVTSPEAPKLKATAGKNQVKLTWDKVECATHYAVYQRIDGKYERIDTLSSKKLSYTVKGLEKGEKYTFKVRAVTKPDSYAAYSAYSSAVKIKSK